MERQSIERPEFIKSQTEVPQHILDDQARAVELQELLNEENDHIDDIVKNFDAIADEGQNVKKLYNLLRIPSSGRLGTMTPEKTRAFYAGALRLRAQELEDLATSGKAEYDVDKFNAIDTLADYFMMPIKLAELQEPKQREAA